MRRVGWTGAEKAESVVAPIITRTTFDKAHLINAIVNGQKRQRGHAERLEIGNCGWMAEAGVGAALCDRNIRVLHRESAHMQFIQNDFAIG